MFLPVEGVGHVNACIGLAEPLRDRGHKIIFVVDNAFKGQLIKYGFIEEIMSEPEKDLTVSQKPGEEPAKEFSQ